MEQILVRNLPIGTKAALRERAQRAGRAVEAEARAIITQALAQQQPNLVDLLYMPEGDEIIFEPEPLGLREREVEW